ncbi:hypothetical protein AVEN_157864-1 [Araneus ventricosus]|uniref:Tc1-like transposase DDE domain-containing protein n=1 Tax=Araneus ventricosus TaxID=182803 RepID=A0A4Y2E9C3_ARAVE|nr:hypothetical protein AVEN_157864-1 [Araneus ventricosus]
MEEDFLQRVMLSDEATFHVLDFVNRHNTGIWGLENPHAVLEQERDSPKLKLLCVLLHYRIIGPFFFSELTVRSDNYLNMLKIFEFLQIEDLQSNIIFQHDGAPPHWSLEVRKVLDKKNSPGVGK